MAYYSRDACRLLFLVVFCLCELWNQFSYALQEQDRIFMHRPAVISNTNNTDIGTVRCYCNLPMCVGTSYMCRSERGGCFSDVLADRNHATHQDVYRARHGCLELLSELQQDLECYNASRSSSSTHSGAPKEGLLWCCFKDMCNHVDNIDILRTVNDTNKGEVTRTEFYGAASATGNTINEDWFKAATIAVPICGALILFMLIALAVKILKTEGANDRSSKLGNHFISEASVEKHYSSPSNSLNCMPLLLQVCDNENSNSSTCANHSMNKNSTRSGATALPLLVQNQTGTKISYEKKNEANAKLNFVSNLEYNLLPGAPDIPNNLQKMTNNLESTLYKDISLSNTNSSSNDVESKLYNKDVGWS